MEPLLPQATRFPEAVGLTTFNVQVDELESAHDDGLVVCEVRAAEVAIKVGGEQISVARRSETGKGHAVAQPDTADLAGQQEFPEALTELGPAGDSYEPSRSSPLSPAALKESGDLTRGDESRVRAEISHESVTLRTLHAQHAAAELQVAPLGRDIAANQGQQLGVVVGMAYHTVDLALLVQNEASPFLALLVRRPHRDQRDGLDELRQARPDRLHQQWTK